MLNALEIREKYYDVKVIIEGSAKKQGLPLCTMGRWDTPASLVTWKIDVRS